MLIPDDCFIAKGVVIEANVTLGHRVVIASSNVVVRKGAQLDSACVIADGVEIGTGSWVRAGAVVLRSVPPNAIVEGNPAQVVGYVNLPTPSLQHPPTAMDVRNIEHMARPARLPLDVGDSALFLMRKIVDARGSLTVGEVPAEVPFSPARYFVVYDVPSEELRGEHAHKHCQQFLVCVHGSCRVLLDDGKQRCEVTIDRPDIGIFMPEMIWGTQYRYSADAVLLVFASLPYEADDYLRTYDEFLAEVERTK